MTGKTSFTHEQLRSIIWRIERLEEDRKTIAGDIKEVYAEAKANGFDTKILRKVISLRKKEPSEREEEQSMLDVYMAALGMVADDGIWNKPRQDTNGPVASEVMSAAEEAPTTAASAGGSCEAMP